MIFMHNLEKKKFFKQLLSGVFIISLLGYIVISVYADTQDSMNFTINVANNAPSVGSPSDNSSSVSTPTNVGSNVTFTTTATDSNGDGYWLAICKTGGSIVADEAGGAPSCTAGNWCISSSAVASGSQNTCTYTALQADSMSNAWEAYTCDNNSTGSSCSSSNTGDSPFNVNHPPVIGTVTIGPSYGSSASVAPGNGSTGEVYFRVGVTDPDTESPADTVDMYACSPDTTSFDASSGACTGGSLYCSVTGVSSGSNADCTDSNLVPVPTAHALGANAKDVKIYLRDSSSTPLKDDGTNNDYTYEVTDVDPSISSFNVVNNPLVPIAGSSNTQSFSATITDNNGYADVESASGAIYLAPATLKSTGDCNTVSELNCYDISICELSSGSGANVTVTCGTGSHPLTTWFNISPSSSWKAHINSVAGSTTYSFETESSFTVNSLNAISVSELNIPYGSLALGAVSASKTTTLQNAGNIVTDVLIDGLNMTADSNILARAQQHWSPSSSFTWGDSDYTLVENAAVGSASAGCSDRSIAVTSDHNTMTNSPIYWKIKIPSSQASGSYSGTNSFSATPNDCSGGI